MPITTRTTGQKYSLRHFMAGPILDRLDDVEHFRMLPARGFDQVGAGDRHLHTRAVCQVARGHATEVVSSHLQKALLESFPLLEREAGQPVHGLASSFYVGGF